MYDSQAEEWVYGMDYKTNELNVDLSKTFLWWDNKKDNGQQICFDCFTKFIFEFNL